MFDWSARGLVTNIRAEAKIRKKYVSFFGAEKVITVSEYYAEEPDNLQAVTDWKGLELKNRKEMVLAISTLIQRACHRPEKCEAIINLLRALQNEISSDMFHEAMKMTRPELRDASTANENAQQLHKGIENLVNQVN